MEMSRALNNYTSWKDIKKKSADVFSINDTGYYVQSPTSRSVYVYMQTKRRGQNSRIIDVLQFGPIKIN